MYNDNVEKHYLIQETKKLNYIIDTLRKEVQYLKDLYREAVKNSQ